MDSDVVVIVATAAGTLLAGFLGVLLASRETARQFERRLASQRSAWRIEDDIRLDRARYELYAQWLRDHLRARVVTTRIRDELAGEREHLRDAVEELNQLWPRLERRGPHADAIAKAEATRRARREATDALNQTRTLIQEAVNAWPEELDAERWRGRLDADQAAFGAVWAAMRKELRAPTPNESE